jgi:hypothetical protein
MARSKAVRANGRYLPPRTQSILIRRNRRTAAVWRRCASSWSIVPRNVEINPDSPLNLQNKYVSPAACPTHVSSSGGRQYFIAPAPAFCGTPFSTPCKAAASDLVAKCVPASAGTATVCGNPCCSLRSHGRRARERASRQAGFRLRKKARTSEFPLHAPFFLASRWPAQCAHFRRAKYNSAADPYVSRCRLETSPSIRELPSIDHQ